MMSSRFMCLAVLASLAACKAKQQPPPPPPASEPSAPRTGHLEHGMEHCPSAVRGASTRMTETPDGVDLTITATEPAATRDIVARAALQAQMGQPSGTEEHIGKHGGPGTIGACPIIHAGTAVSVEDVPDGVLVHVRALDRNDMQALRNDTAARIAALTNPNA